jgi:sphinganine-1-phosphate aldolase
MEKQFNDKGMSGEDLLDYMGSLRGEDKDFKGGKIWNLVYHISEEQDEVMKKAHNMFFSENYLNPLAFKSLKNLETELLKMGVEIFHGDDQVVGSITSGGTESILLPCKTYRDMAKAQKPWIRNPNMVAPETIHVAFEKAAKYFGIKIIKVPVTDDYRVNMKKFKKAINRNTIMLAASAPQYVHGQTDPIEEIGALAVKHKIPFHVDSCIGGFVLPFMEELGHDVPLFDFRVAGVTSISADLHKYGYTPKGASMLLYKSMDYMRHQFFVSTTWSGGVYASANIPGSRPGAPIAAAWATLKYMGKEGFLRETKKILEVKDKLIKGISAINGIEVVGNPTASIVCYKSTDRNLSIFAVEDQLETKGWYADKHATPESIHLTVMGNHAQSVDEYLFDLNEAVKYVKDHPELAKSGDAAIYGLMAKVPAKGLLKKSVLKVMEGVYGLNADIPDIGDAAGGDSQDPMLRFVNKHQDKVFKVLDKVNSIKDKFMS